MSDSPIRTTEFITPLARVFQLARSQGYITYDQILRIWPDPEGALDQVDRLFGALIAAGIPYGDENGFERNDGLDD